MAKPLNIYDTLEANGFRREEQPQAYYKALRNGGTIKVKRLIEGKKVGLKFRILAWDATGELITDKILNAQNRFHRKVIARELSQA